MLSPSTIANRRLVCDKLVWYLEREKIEECDRFALKGFFAYLVDGHNDTHGRWSSSASDVHPQRSKPIKPSTAATYHRVLKSFFAFLVIEEFLDESPMTRISPPVEPRDQVQPVTREDLAKLFDAAVRSMYPKRNLAIVLFFLDTGCRNSELCNLTMQDLHREEGYAIVLGKGRKRRQVRFCPETRRALNQYLRGHDRQDADPVFTSEKGLTAGEKLTRWGVDQLFQKLIKAAGIPRATPHTLRHTFAIEFLRSPGSNQFSLMTLLGHTSLDMTKRYLAIAEADIEAQHVAHSPVKKIMKEIRKRA